MQKYEHITPQKLEKWLEDQKVALIDVREPAEYQAEHIPGAVNKPLSSWSDDSLKTLAEKNVVFQCASGNRSCRILDKITAPSHDIRFYNLDGGIKAWKEAKLPTVHSGARILPLDRQVQITLGSLILIFSLLGFFVNANFLFVPAFIGAGLLNAGLTGWCGLALLVAKMPWNKTV